MGIAAMGPGIAPHEWAKPLISRHAPMKDHGLSWEHGGLVPVGDPWGLGEACLWEGRRQGQPVGRIRPAVLKDRDQSPAFVITYNS
jgi:hypothetical protein